jgi:preprotein translocase subunit YajC
MSNQLIHRAISRVVLSALAAAVTFFVVPPAMAQNPQLQERLGEIKQASAANKQALAHYTWQEQQTISLKGEVKKTQLFQVTIGPDGQQQKTELDSSPAPQPSGRRVKQRIVEKKTEEYQQYGQQIADLAKQYTQPDPQKLQQAYQQGNVSLQSGGGEGEVTLVIKNYIKPNDSVKLVFNRQAKALQSMQVNTYLNDPSDAVTISAQLAKLPDGTNHVATTQINGVSKQLTVANQNSNYHPG